MKKYLDTQGYVGKGRNRNYNKRITLDLVFHYVKELEKLKPGAYFNTNAVRTLTLKNTREIHGWETFKNRLEKLEKKGYIESVMTHWGKIWRLKKDGENNVE